MLLLFYYKKFILIKNKKIYVNKYLGDNSHCQ